MYNQLCHAGPILLSRRQIQIADDFLAGTARRRTDGQQVLGASMGQLPQDLLTDRCNVVEFSCRGDKFTYLLLLLRR